MNIVIKWTLMSFKKNGYNLYKNIISKELTNFLYSYLNTKKEVYFTFQKLKRISPYNLDWGAIGDQAVPGTITHMEILLWITCCKFYNQL